MDEERKKKAAAAGIDFTVYAETGEALELAGVKTIRSLQRYVDNEVLSVRKVQLDGERAKSNFYPRDELRAIKEKRDQVKPATNALTTTHDAEHENLSPVVAEQIFKPLEGILLQIGEALEEIRGNQKQLPPAQEEPPPAQTAKSFLTAEEAHQEFGLATSYLNELWKKGVSITQHKGDHGKRLFSRKELENL